MLKPLILVTNDDGITAPGLKALVYTAARFGEIVVVAPNKPQSGQGHAITIHDPLRLTPSDVFPGIAAYECSGTPVDCVKLAKHVVLKDRSIDLCVSGINHGSNASINIIYSGTMSAAMEASVEGIRSIGFSLMDYSYQADFSAAAHWAGILIQHALNNGVKPGQLLNVNFPKGNLSDIKGMKVCRQAKGRWVEEFMEGRDPSGKPYYWLTGKFINEDQSTDADVLALEQGYISVVPSMHDLTDYKAMPDFKAIETL
jgi:5'-nucleotidase